MMMMMPRDQGHSRSAWSRADHAGATSGLQVAAYGRSQKMTVLQPPTKERRKTSINQPTSMFQLFGACCRMKVFELFLVIFFRAFLVSEVSGLGFEIDKANDLGLKVTKALRLGT